MRQVFSASPLQVPLLYMLFFAVRVDYCVG